MLRATEASAASKDALIKRQAEVSDKVESVIRAAINQGSCKATYYPRNDFETQLASKMLTDAGYLIDVHTAQSQRDDARINIQWGVV